ncbi:MAG: hypothetical protein Q8P49_02250 [Candidatus Liptonbacteria bacterium]|nr:hypothetical protein [Candidatus Liptonbacteria bacterium]
MKDRKRVVQSATEDDVRRYIRRKKYRLSVLLVFGCEMAVLLYVVVKTVITVGWNGQMDGASFAVLLLSSVALLATAFFYLGSMGIPTCKFQLLKRWEEVTGGSATEFPTSPDLVAGLREWAVAELSFLGGWANDCFENQKNYRDAYDDLNKRQIKPGEISQHRLDIAESQRLSLRADECAKNVHKKFLAFWDLVTDKPDKGIGILTGPKWQNPERFRKGLFEKTASAA